MTRKDPMLPVPDDDVAQSFCEAATAGDHARVSEYLATYGANIIDRKGNRGCTALMCAVGMQQEDTVELLLKHNPNLEETDARGETALFHAATAMRIETLRRLLALGANVNAQNNIGGTALMHAAHWGYQTIAELLLQHKADATLKNSAGHTALMFLIQGASALEAEKSVAMARQLLHCGASVHDRDCDLSTPLMFAAAYNRPFLVPVLLENGARLDERNKNGQTAIEIAHDRQLTNVVRAFEKFEVKKLEQAEQRINRAQLQAVRQLHRPTRFARGPK